MLGAGYHYDYGYPWRWAIPAEVCWQLEHVGRYRGGEGGLFGYLHRWAYRWRKHYERLGYREQEALGT